MLKTKETLQSNFIEPCLLKEYAVASYLTVSVQKIRAMRKGDKGPPFIRIGKSVRYLIADLQEYLRSLSKVSKAVCVKTKQPQAKAITPLAPKPIHSEDIADPLIDSNKASAPNFMLQDIFTPQDIDDIADFGTSGRVEPINNSTIGETV
jgi:hypothetical protein